MPEPNGTQTPQQTVVRTSPTIGTLVAALAKAQRKLKNPERNRTVTVRTKAGGTYEFAYATLDAILDQVRPILADEGIAILQGVQCGQSHIAVSTMLADSSGEWVESVVRFQMPSGPQEIGSLISYGKRYTLTGLVAISAEEDDDANSAAGNAVQRQETKGDTHVEKDPVEGTQVWVGKIVNLKSKKGQNKETGKPWEKFILVGADGDEFSTFSSSMMQTVRDAGKEVEFQVAYTKSKYGNEVLSLAVLDDDPEIPF